MLVLPRRFNATTSIINYGAKTRHEISGEQSIYVVTRILGAGEGNQGYVFSHSNNGPSGIRLVHVDSGAGVTSWRFGADSGVAAQPFQDSATGAITYGSVQRCLATWDGGLNASGINLYVAENAASLALSAGASGNGATAINGPAGQPVVVGNRQNGDRTVNGDIFYMFRWPFILTAGQRRILDKEGPLSIPGWFFGWWDGEEHGPNHLTAGTVTALGYGPESPYAQLPLDEDYEDEDWIAAVATSSIKTINGLARASVKTVNGLALASVKTVNGLA